MITSAILMMACGQVPDITKLRIAPATPGFSTRYLTCHDGDTCSMILILEDEEKTLDFGIERQTITKLTASVRLCGIDTPELPTAKGVAAKTAINSWLQPAKVVTVETFGLDKYGRVLGRVWADGVDVNKRLLAEGFAAPYLECK